MAIDITAVTLTELRYIVATADHRHFGRAARACSVTQPTLSAQIQKLERTLGVRLFERTSKAVHVTPLGAEIVEEARRVLDATAKIRDLAQRGDDPLSGPLRLGVIPTLGPYLLPWLVRPLRKSYPRLKLILRELKTADMIEELSQHKLDCGVMALPIAGAALMHELLFDEPFWLIAPADHPLAAKMRIHEADLEGERVLLLDEGHCLRDQALAICRDDATGEHVPDDFRATSLETLRHMVAAGMGCTLMPALALDERRTNDRKIAHVPFATPGPARRMALFWRRTHPRDEDFRMLAQLIRAEVPDSVRALSGKNAARGSTP